MLKDYAYGVIPLMKKNNTWYTVIILLSSWNHRWLPKWHWEKWETALESAMREFHEETGLILKTEQINIEKTYTDKYISFSKRHNQDVDKTVTYYTAIIPYTDFTNLSWYSENDWEILGKKVVTLDEAIINVTYDQTRSLLKKVKNEL